ncbi:DUF5367 family protein [Flagellimonas aequoris]|uniref:DUF5367 domain-containing protein n=1 Tax=Flagellimonas aequoris TaxID=2306997 RepID=A0A418N3V6_9FLAO|nr:DUF5367 family protein [Allomuricauda aequoris]RIV68581.1 hypothetical protein D2U88_15370 [Allomuricauda aequoris]TXK00279.1 hypothetical protein FQ019_15200 [Allomuricauda aequoris]
MKQLRVVGIGTIIWIIGVSLYTLSSYIQILKDPELQANIILSIGILPPVWFGSKLYYRKNSTTKGYWIGLAFFSIATILDALITVPILIVPNGGTYHSFFTTIGFWLIGIEIVTTATLYWYTSVFGKRNTTEIYKN